MLAVYVIAVVCDHITIGTSFNYASCSCNNYLMNMLYFLIAMAALITTSKKIDTIKPLNYIGENTLLFYYFNVLMLRVAGMVYDKGLALAHLSSVKESLGYGNYIIVTILAVAGTFPLVWFINKFIPLLTGRKDAYINITKKLKLNINW